MQLAESSTWELSTCVGACQALYLTKGVRFRLQFMDQSEEFTWVGVRGHVSFVIPAVEDGGRAPAAGDSDSRRILDGEVRIEMLEGIGPRASQLKHVSARDAQASPRRGFRSPLRPESGEERAKGARAARGERTPTDLSGGWKPPASGSGQIRSHYQIEISATTSPSGTYYPWKGCGAALGTRVPTRGTISLNERGTPPRSK